MSSVSAVNEPTPRVVPVAGSYLSAAASLSGLLLALGTLVGICLHLTGHVAHITQLRDQGVPSDLFPHGVEWTMINGYYAIYQQWGLMLSDMPWLMLVLACLLLAYAIWLYRLPARKRRELWTDRWPKWIRDITSATLTSATLITVAVYLSFLFLLIAVIPAYIGERAGHHSAEKDLAVFRSTRPDAAPAEIWRSGKRLMRGHVVAASTDLLALYDADTTRIRMIDRSGVELSTLPRLQGVEDKRRLESE